MAQDETIARLADDYEQGAILDFYFADQLKGIESTGFDVGSFLGDMIASPLILFAKPTGLMKLPRRDSVRWRPGERACLPDALRSKRRSIRKPKRRGRRCLSEGLAK